MPDERHEDEGAKAFDPKLARRLLRYLKPYRVRTVTSVFLIILSSALEIVGPAIIAVSIDLFVQPLRGAHPIGISARIGHFLQAHGWMPDPMTGITVAAVFYLTT